MAMLAATDIVAILISVLNEPWARIGLAIVGVLMLWSGAKPANMNIMDFLKSWWAKLFAPAPTPKPEEQLAAEAAADPMARFRIACELREWLRTRNKTEAVESFDKNIWPHLVEDSLLTKAVK